MNFPGVFPSILPLMLAVTLAAPAHALLCTPHNAQASAAWSQLYMKTGDLRPGTVLLGLDGSRVVVPTDLAPLPSSPAWHGRVDWKKHAVAAATSPQLSILYFDISDPARSYLCRIDKRDYSESYIARNQATRPPAPPGPADLFVVERTSFSYDGKGRLAGASDAEWSPAHNALKAKSGACFHYDQADRYVGASPALSANCAGAKPEQIEDRYVYTGDGKLLRKISLEKRMPGLDGKPFVTHEARVTIYDARGKLAAEYVEGDDKRYYRRSLARGPAPQNYTIKVVGSAAALDPRTLLGADGIGHWQFYAIPAGAPRQDSGMPGPEFLVAAGDEPTLLKAARAKIWSAVNQPSGEVRLLAQGGYLLVPEVAPALWARCMDHTSNTSESCP